MAITVTTITSAANLGTTTELRNQSPTKTTLATSTTMIGLNIKLASTGSVTKPGFVEVCFAISPCVFTADTTLEKFLAGQFTSVRVPTNRTGNIEVNYQIPDDGTKFLFNNGGLLYTWFNSPPLVPSGTTPTITITSVELP